MPKEFEFENCSVIVLAPLSRAFNHMKIREKMLPMYLLNADLAVRFYTSSEFHIAAAYHWITPSIVQHVYIFL